MMTHFRFMLQIVHDSQTPRCTQGKLLPEPVEEELPELIAELLPEQVPQAQGPSTWASNQTPFRLLPNL